MGLSRDVVELATLFREGDDVDLFASIERGGLQIRTEFSAILSRTARLEPIVVGMSFGNALLWCAYSSDMHRANAHRA